MIFEVTYKFPSGGFATRSGREYSQVVKVFEQERQDIVVALYGRTPLLYETDTEKRIMEETLLLEGARTLLGTVMKALPIGFPLTLTGTTHNDFYIAPVEVVITKKEE